MPVRSAARAGSCSPADLAGHRNELAGVQLGLYSFAEVAMAAPGRAAGDPGERLRDLLEEIELADQVGLDVFGVGEHHRADYAVSAPGVVLAAAATRTKRIRLTSAVNVLSSDDPVRVFQEFATIDQISNGRAEIMAGRGSFIESFPLFGYDLDDYESLFAEKLDLLLALRRGGRITWSGKHRASIDGIAVHPKPKQDPLPVWIAVGGTPQSVARAATLGLPMALAIIGGEPERFAPLVRLHRDRAAAAGHDPAPAVGINSHGWIAEDSAAAAREAWPPYAEVMTRIGRERGWPPADRMRFDAEREPRGALLVGSPEEVAEKILFEHSIFDMQRFLLQLTVGPMPHDRVMKAIELYGTRVAPLVRKEIAARNSATARR